MKQLDDFDFTEGSLGENNLNVKLLRHLNSLQNKGLPILVNTGEIGPVIGTGGKSQCFRAMLLSVCQWEFRNLVVWSYYKIFMIF